MIAWFYCLFGVVYKRGQIAAKERGIFLRFFRIYLMSSMNGGNRPIEGNGGVSKGRSQAFLSPNKLKCRILKAGSKFFYCTIGGSEQACTSIMRYIMIFS